MSYAGIEKQIRGRKYLFREFGKYARSNVKRSIIILNVELVEYYNITLCVRSAEHNDAII